MIKPYDSPLFPDESDAASKSFPFWNRLTLASFSMQ